MCVYVYPYTSSRVRASEKILKRHQSLYVFIRIVFLFIGFAQVIARFELFLFGYSHVHVRRTHGRGGTESHAALLISHAISLDNLISMRFRLVELVSIALFNVVDGRRFAAL